MMNSPCKIRVLRLPLSRLILLIGLIAGLALPSLALAQGGSSFSLTPYSLETQTNLPRFVFDAQPGESFQSAVLVKNQGTEPIDLILYAVDVRTAVNGNLDFGGRDDLPTGVGLWLTLDQPERSLAAGESQIVPFTVHVPDTAQPGTHRAGIMGEKTTPTVGEAVTAGEGEVAVKYLFREGLNVRITLPGPTKTEFAISGVTQSVENNDTIFTVEMNNTGSEDVQIAGGAIQVFDGTGQKVGDQPIPMSGFFLAGDTVLHPVRFTGLLPEGHYSTAASVNYGADAPAQWQSEFDIAPAAPQAQAAEINQGFTLASPDAADQSAASVPEETTAMAEVSDKGIEPVWVYILGTMLVLVLVILVIVLKRSRSATTQSPN